MPERSALVARLLADLLTVHAGGGPSMLEAAARAAEGRVGILAVTVLTSLDELDFDGRQRLLTAGHRDDGESGELEDVATVGEGELTGTLGRLPTEEEFATWQADYDAVAPNPADFFPFLERMQPVVHDWPGWTDDEIRSVTAPTFLVIGDQDFVRLDHAAEMLDLFPDCRLAVLPGTKHTEVMQRSEQLRALVVGHVPELCDRIVGLGVHLDVGDAGGRGAGRLDPSRRHEEARCGHLPDDLRRATGRLAQRR